MSVDHTFFGSKQKVDRNASGCWITASISPYVLNPSRNLGNNENNGHVATAFRHASNLKWILQRFVLAKFSEFSDLLTFFFVHEISDLLSLAKLNLL